MYLKSLEIVGFKSFADKTRLEFEPGMTCIVGPNGCGKSNVADAVRWVIGEQSAKALRGSSMTDCIFTGTDSRKPLGMAEVSISFAECEGVLDTEYDEVTITRRVFRDGQGQYLINKTPCRLKDIQRMFMDTGIGTASYSLLEQGRIDRILSARPEDRREVFEEASGITKFKRDKEEAIRKLERTEANLLRLADVIREVKRQIGSLQRQAGKARRYKDLQEELKGLDLYVTRERIRSLDKGLAKVEKDLSGIDNHVGEAHAQVADLERQATALRHELAETDRLIESALEANVQARTKLNHTRELIATNKRRIDEYQAWAERDTQEIDRNRQALDEHRRHAGELTGKLAEEKKRHAAADARLQQASASYSEHQREIDDARSRMEKLREESVELEGLSVRRQNQLVEIENRERATVMQRERLSAEKNQLTRAGADYARRREDMLRQLDAETSRTEKAKAELSELESRRAGIEDDIRKTRKTYGDLHSQATAKRARLDAFAETDVSHRDGAEGTRALLDPGNPLGVDGGAILGRLTDFISVESEYRVALETSLRDALDAVLVRDVASAVAVLETLEQSRGGAAGLLVATTAEDAPDAQGPGVRLLDKVTATPEAAAILAHLIGRVFVVDSVTDLPAAVAAGVVGVTRNGSILTPTGWAEFRMPQAAAASALGRKELTRHLEQELARLDADIRRWQSNANALADQATETDQSIRQARGRLDEARRALAQKEGENQILSREITETRDRLETVTFELESLSEQGRESDDQRKAVADEIESVGRQRREMADAIREQNESLRKLEARHVELQSELTEQRLQFAAIAQELRHLEQQQQSAQSRCAEIERSVEGREAGLKSYQQSIERLAAETAEAEQQMSSLEAAATAAEQKTDERRKEKAAQEARVENVEQALAAQRIRLEELRTAKSELEIRRAEDKLRRQNQIERVTSDYGITVDGLIEAPDPQWPDEQPTIDSIETTIAELRTKLDAMGPVNLVAIEEYKELEERYAFLSEQEQDLTTSKQQLMDMIRTINKTTTELFRETFESVNANFQVMFQRLFNGGSAKLVLVNEEDILECGIEIIARPPGKRLQNVSLLSGGERTMTAVSLLFAIYMIKPSAFCMLDELDAALDDANIGRFVAVLEGFLQQSQFIVITHNRNTIAAASAVYGITMPEKGISRIMSMKFRDTREPQLDMAETR